VSLVVDADVHEYFKGYAALVPYLDPSWRRLITEWGFSRIDVGFPYTSGSVRRTWETRTEWRPRDGGELGSDLDVMRRNLFEELGVSVAIINNLQVPVSFMKGSHELGIALARAYNDQLVECWLEPEPRLRGSLIVSLDDPAEAAREIDRVGGHPRVVQVALPTVVDLELGHPRYNPIWEAIVRNRLVLGLHHGYGTRTLLGYPRQHVEWKVLAPPQAMMSQLASLLFNGVFDALPEFRVVAMEAGFTWLPFFMSRLDQQYVSFREQVPWVRRRPSDHLRDHVALTTQPMEFLSGRQFTNLVEDCGAEGMLLFSSDYPHYDSDVVSEALPAGVPDDLRARVMGGNAARVYPKLDVPAPDVPA
jgi:predicted TIM-barrel fold metal-dependent hydrolase